jgi:hypothetical protein
VVDGGHVLEHELRRHHLTREDILEELRHQLHTERLEDISAGCSSATGTSASSAGDAHASSSSSIHLLHSLPVALHTRTRSLHGSSTHNASAATLPFLRMRARSACQRLFAASADIPSRWPASALVYPSIPQYKSSERSSGESFPTYSRKP